MALPVTVPNQFASATTSIPLSQLDTNFDTLSNAINGIANGVESLANVQVTGGAISNVSITSSNVVSTDVEVIAGTGLTGGGNLSANVTLSIANTAVSPSTYGGGTNAAQITVDQQGRVTAAANVAIPQGTVTSVDVSGGTTGLTTSGGPVTGSGTITLAGTLAVANGGTGSTSTTFVNLATNVTGTLPVANGGTGITSFGTGVATFLGTPSSANFASALTDETGTGVAVFGTNPTLTGVTLAGEAACADNLVTRATLKDYAIEGSAIGNVGATRTFDLSVANFFSATVDQASTFTFSNPPASGDFGTFVMELTNGGAFVVTFPASVDWPGGTAPSLTASGKDQLVFTTRDGGTTYFGFVAGLDIKSP